MNFFDIQDPFYQEQCASWLKMDGHSEQNNKKIRNCPTCSKRAHPPNGAINHETHSDKKQMVSFVPSRIS
jgi:hypothetical protein